MPSEPRYITAHLELPNDGTLRSVRIYVKSDDGNDLSAQEILDAVSDALIDTIEYFEGEVPYEPNYDA